MALRAFSAITKLRKLLCILTLVPFILYYCISVTNPDGIRHLLAERPLPIHLGVVVCGDRSDEALVMLKSSVLFTRTPLVFHIFAETQLHASLQEHLLAWPDRFRKKLQFHFYPIQYLGGNQSSWDKPRGPCVAQRLFLPELLPTIDSIFCVDTDMIFLSPLDDIVEQFHRFNSTHLAAMTPDSTDSSKAYYGRVAQIPFYGSYGLNSGVLLMNLARLRKVKFIDQIIAYKEFYHPKLVFVDQDLWNIYFHFYPERVYVLSCHYNYFHCIANLKCYEAEERGAYLMHGYSRGFMKEDQPALRALYSIFKEVGSRV